MCSSFDTSFYPSAPLFTAPLNAQLSRHAPHGPSSASLFTPPTTSALPTATAPGVKRTRAGNVAPASSANPTGYDEETSNIGGGRGKRIVRGVPGDTSKPRRGAAAISGAIEAPTTRRSSRLSRDTGSSNGVASVGMTTTRSQTSASGGSGGILKSANSRDKKRSKANTGPSVLSDAGSEPLSPPSHSSSPAPSSPGGSNAAVIAQANLPDQARQDAEDYITSILRGFGKAAVAQSKYENLKVMDALGNLPLEQQRSTKCLIMSGRAHFEALNYEKVSLSFASSSPRFASLNFGVSAGRESFRTSSNTLSSPSRWDGSLLDDSLASTPLYASLALITRSYAPIGNAFIELDLNWQCFLTQFGSRFRPQVFQTSSTTRSKLCLCVYSRRPRMHHVGRVGESDGLLPRSNQTRSSSLQRLVRSPSLCATLLD